VEASPFDTKSFQATANSSVAKLRARILNLKRDEIGMNRQRALGCGLIMIFPENRCALFRITL
jgi:hypothetical protein